MAREKKIAPDERVEVRFTTQERDFILDHTLVDGEVIRLLRLAEIRNGQILARLTLDDLDEIIGYIAAEANHTSNKRLEKELGALFGRLQDELQSYDDGQWPNAF